MNIFIFFVLLNINSAFAFLGMEEEILDEVPAQEKSAEAKFLKTYCLSAKGSVTGEPKYSSAESFTCAIGRTPQFFYESWRGQKIRSNTKSLKPQITQTEREYYETSYMIFLAKKNNDENFQKCYEESKITPNKICKELEKLREEPKFESKMITALNTYGQVAYVANNLPNTAKPSKVEENVTQAPVSAPVSEEKVEVENKTATNVVPPQIPETQTSLASTTIPEVAVAEVVSTTPVNQEASSVVANVSCHYKLKQEIASLLADDTKNIIGLQYELTVLKMASATSGASVKSFEELIKKKSKAIASIDDGVLKKMNSMYKEHGLPEDAAEITNHLKQKVSTANYYAKDKRFFNKDSSAFLLAYQSLTPDSGIKDSDVSVLWFMEKVSSKAISKFKKYQEEHNLTNLSTRIAQYTGAINPNKAMSKTVLDEMVVKQRSKIEVEFSALIERFKTSNIDCFKQIFDASGADKECNMDVVNKVFSQLLAVNSKIESIKLISLDAQLKGGLDKARFKIARYVDSPAEAVKPPKIVEPQILIDDNTLGGTPEKELENSSTPIETNVNEAHLGPDDNVLN